MDEVVVWVKSFRHVDMVVVVLRRLGRHCVVVMLVVVVLV